MKTPRKNRIQTCSNAAIAAFCALFSIGVCQAVEFEDFEQDSLGNINQRNVGVFKSNRHSDNDIHSQSEVISKELDLAPFTTLKVELPVNLIFSASGNSRAEIQGPKDVVDKLLFVENGGRLTLRSTSFNSNEQVSIKLFGADLKRVFVKSAADVELNSIDSQDFLLSVQGAADVQVRGNAMHCKIDLKGAADVDLSRLRCQNVALTALGTADATLYASKKITGLAQGAGDISVLGAPDKRELNALGAYDISFD